MTSESHSGLRYAQFLQDFAKTLGEIPNSYLEISFADKGGSVFSRAIYHNEVTRHDLEKYAVQAENVSFLSGCDRSYLPVTVGVLTKRIANNQCIRQKNLLIFDIDFKDHIPSYADLSQEARLLVIREEKSRILRVLKEHATPFWAVNFSGNGLHIYFKLFTPIDMNPQTYKSFYLSMLEHLEKTCAVRFDRSCSNPARLIRLPLSTNWKNPNHPIPTEILAYQPDADATPFVQQFMNLTAPEVKSSFPGKKELLSRLDLHKILSFFKYEKFDSITETDRKITCSSPFAQDSSPSFQYDKDKRLFFDFSTARSGDLLNLIAFHTQLDIKRDFRSVVQIARKIAGLVDPQNQSSEGGCYEIKESGVWFLPSTQENGSTEGYWVSSYLEIIASARDHINQGWGRVLRIRDKEGVEKTWTMPMELLAGDGLELRKKLLNLGVHLNLSPRGRTHLTQFLSEAKTSSYVRTVDTLGWEGDSFVLPERVVAPHEQGNEDVLLNRPERYRVFRVQGDLAEWQNSVGRYAQGNSRLILALAAAFAPPLLKLCGEENFGIHLVGPSSIGKTITLDVAGSVWGGGQSRGYKTRWRTTVNGLEGLALKHNDTLLTLDELAEISPTNAGAAAYMLANGTGKVRSSRDGQLLEPAEWRLVFLSAGEIDLATHLESEGQRRQAGQEMRMITIDADAGKGLGVFENIHGFFSPSDFADHLRQGSLLSFGTPIRKFIDKVVNLGRLRDVVQKYKAEFRHAHEKSTFHGQGRRILSHFEVLYSAGNLAVDFGILAMTSRELGESLGEVFTDWMERNGQTCLEAESVLGRISLYLQQYGFSRFPVLDHREPGHQTSQQCSGFRKRNSDGDYEWFILGDVFKKEICMGYNFKTVISILRDRKLLKLDGSGRSTITLRTPLGKLRAYHLLSRINNPDSTEIDAPHLPHSRHHLQDDKI